MAMQLKPNCPIGAKRGEKIFYLFFSSKFAVTLLRSTAIACNGLRLCVRLRSVGIERSGSLHKTAVISWRGLLTENLNRSNERKNKK